MSALAGGITAAWTGAPAAGAGPAGTGPSSRPSIVPSGADVYATHVPLLLQLGVPALFGSPVRASTPHPPLLGAAGAADGRPASPDPVHSRLIQARSETTTLEQGAEPVPLWQASWIGSS